MRVEEEEGVTSKVSPTSFVDFFPLPSYLHNLVMASSDALDSSPLSHDS